MDTITPILFFCLELLRETLALKLPDDHDTPTNVGSNVGNLNKGPKRSQVRAAIAAVEVWLDLHSSLLVRPPTTTSLTPSQQPTPAASPGATQPGKYSEETKQVTPRSSLAIRPTASPPPISASPPPNIVPSLIPSHVNSMIAASTPGVMTPNTPIDLALLAASIQGGEGGQGADALIMGMNQRFSMASSRFSTDTTDTVFRWPDPELLSISSLERFTYQILPQLVGTERSLSVKRLDFRAFDSVACLPLLHAIVRLCPNVESLLLAFTSPCPNLHFLQHILCASATLTSASHPANPRITALALHAVGDALAPSEEVNVAAFTPSTTSPLTPLTTLLARLEALSIDTSVDGPTIQFIAESCGASLKRFEVVSGTSHGHLEILAAATVRAVESSAASSASSSSTDLSPSLPSLEELGKSDGESSIVRETVMPEHIITLISRSPNLESMNLAGCTAMSFFNAAAAASAANSTSNPSISTIAQHPADPILNAIASKLPKLKALRTPPDVSPTSLTNVLRACSLLEDLDLGPLAPKYPVEAIRALSEHGQSLRNLAFRFQPPPTTPSSTSLSASQAAASATAIVMELDNALTDLLERRGRLLRGLDGLGWPAGDRVLRAIAKHCASLDSCVLFPCGNVKSEAAVKDLVVRCKKLTHLQLRGLASPAVGGKSGVAAVVDAGEKEVRSRAKLMNVVGRRRLEIATIVI